MKIYFWRNLRFWRRKVWNDFVPKICFILLRIFTVSLTTWRTYFDTILTASIMSLTVWALLIVLLDALNWHLMVCNHLRTKCSLQRSPKHWAVGVSSGPRARLLHWQSEFESRWSLKFFMYNLICVWKEWKYTKKAGAGTFKKVTQDEKDRKMKSILSCHFMLRSQTHYLKKLKWERPLVSIVNIYILLC